MPRVLQAAASGSKNLNVVVGLRVWGLGFGVDLEGPFGQFIQGPIGS